MANQYFSFAMIVSCAIDLGGSFPRSARNAVHASFFDVARIRADPLEKKPPRLELIGEPPEASWLRGVALGKRRGKGGGRVGHLPPV